MRGGARVQSKRCNRGEHRTEWHDQPGERTDHAAHPRSSKRCRAARLDAVRLSRAAPACRRRVTHAEPHHASGTRFMQVKKGRLFACPNAYVLFRDSSYFKTSFLQGLRVIHAPKLPLLSCHRPTMVEPSKEIARTSVSATSRGITAPRATSAALRGCMPVFPVQRKGRVCQV